MTIKSYLMWLTSGLLMLLCIFLCYMFLPKDNQREIESTNNKGIVFIFKKDFSYLFGFIKNKENKIFKTIFIEYILNYC